MKGKFEITHPDGEEQTLLAAWKQVMGVKQIDIANGTGLSSRTIYTALNGGEISFGSASLISVHTKLPRDTVKEGEKRGTWTITFRAGAGKLGVKP